MESVFVSICIPTYNGETYLRQCLDSCLDQQFKDYEILICDDGSIDGSLAIIETYAKLHTKIRFIKNEKNLGLVENWNKCISEARGEWIKFVFQDDYITQNCLSTFVGAIEASSSLIVCKRNFILPENADKETITYYAQTVRTLENTSQFKGKFYSPKLLSVIAMENMCMNFIGEPSLIFFRKSSVNELGDFNRHLKQICDFEFALRLGTNFGLTYISEKLCAFRIHAESTTSTNISNKYFILRYIEPLLYAYFLLFDVKFKNFRKNLNFSQRIKLKLYFKVKSYHAYKKNLAEAQDHSIFKESNNLFKEIRAIKQGDFITRLVALVKK